MSLALLYFSARCRSSEEARRGNRRGRFAAELRRVRAPAERAAENRSLILLSTSGAFRSMTQNALLTFLPLFLAHQLGYSVFMIGASMFALQAAGFAAAPVAGHLSDKFGRRSVMVSTMAMTAVVLCLHGGGAGFEMPSSSSSPCSGFFLYAIRPVIQAWLLEATPKNMGGSGIGILFGAQSLGSSLAPLIGGSSRTAMGLHATFYFLAATIVVANLFILLMPKSAGRAA
jgi:sugar phosphate permease